MKNVFVQALITLCLASLGAACSGLETSSLSGDELGDIPLFVALGGYDSCGDETVIDNPSPFTMDLYAPFSRLMQRLRNESGVEAGFLATCFTSENETIQVVSSETGTRVRMLPFVDFTDFVIAQTRVRGKNRPLYLLGHSHGGWVAMTIAANLESDARLKRVETLDPISYIECTRDTFLNWATGRSNPECLRAPSDISVQTKEIIMERSLSWTNTFETQSAYLHSSQIPETSDNVLLNMRINSIFGINAHTDIDTDARVWTSINQRVMSDF